MSFMSILGAIAQPVADIIDELHTSDEERGKLRAALMASQIEAGSRLLDYEKERIRMQSDIVKAEAGAQSWLTRTWRPLTMMTFLGLVVSYWLGYTPPNVSEAALMEVFGLIKLGLGGYVIGRSAEKVIPNVAQMFKSDPSGK